MKIMLLIFILSSISACIRPEYNSHHPSSSDSPLQAITDRFTSKRSAQEALQKADRIFPKDSAFLSDSLCRIALRYYQTQKASAELARIYFYRGNYYNNQKLYKKAIEAYIFAENTLPAGCDRILKENITQKLTALNLLLGQEESESVQWQTRYEISQEKVNNLQNRLNIWKTMCLLLGTTLLTILLIYHYRTTHRKRELFESQLFIEKLQRAEDDLQEKLTRRLDEKDVKLKDFFNQRVGQIKEFVELSRKYGNNLEKLKAKFNSMVSTSSFTASDWQLLREGVNAIDYGIIDYLEQHYPNLTEENLRYCALICAGFETDELAILWEISNDSIYKRRTRLRQKLGIEKNQDLKLFFNELTQKLRTKNPSFFRVSPPSCPCPDL